MVRQREQLEQRARPEPLSASLQQASLFTRVVNTTPRFRGSAFCAPPIRIICEF
jgi:hypothetical protein